ncbi:MAG: hypothetical protein ACREM2_03385 [Vulcanimicrobiaceae bacterium]
MLRSARVTSKEAIETLLRHGLSPITDNRAALAELGFSRAYPRASDGFEASIWERSVDCSGNASTGALHRTLVCQRAYLETERAQA